MVGVIRCKHHNSYHYHLSLREQPYNIISLTQSVGASHLMRVEPIEMTLLLDFVCAIRYRLFDCVVRAPADSRKREGQKAFYFCVNRYVTLPHTPSCEGAYALIRCSIRELVSHRRVLG